MLVLLVARVPVFWTPVQLGGSLAPVMRRRLCVRVAFEPTRLSDERLRRAYEQIVPVRRSEVEVAVATRTEDSVKAQPAPEPARTGVAS